VVSYVVSLRGPEGMLLDLEGLHRNWSRPEDDSFLYIALLGRIKGEHQDRCHLIPASAVTGSNIDVKFSVERLLQHKANKGYRDGPAISDENGRLFPTRAIDDMLHEVLEDLFDSDRELFPPQIENEEQVRTRYQAFRTFRRTSDTRAIQKRVSQDDIDVVNRWKQVEQAKGSRPGRPMRHYYADVVLLKEPFMRYTKAM
jgi:hypothetical protein